VLLLHRHLSHTDVLAGITATLAVGTTSPDVVAVEARKAQHRQTGQPATAQHPDPAAGVVTLAARRLASATAGDDRPPPSVAVYDSLLTATATT